MNEKEFRNNVAAQENEPLFFKVQGTRVYPNPAPEDGGGQDIGFGHKIQPEEYERGLIHGVRWKGGITREEALTILSFDIKVHEGRARNKFGSVEFDSLPRSGQQLLTDFSFTGTLNSFPKLFKAIKERNIVGVLNNYKRFFRYRGKLVEMHRRNAFAYRLIKELVDEGYFK